LRVKRRMTDPQKWIEHLLNLGFSIQRHLHEVLIKGDDGLALPVGFESGDTIFEIDLQVEPIIKREIDAWPSDYKPLVLIAEGMGKNGRLTFGPTQGPARFRVIVDPIDGTRNLMHDKRSAWFIAAVAEDRAEQTRLSDSFAAVLVELATSKQTWCDAYAATSSGATTGVRTHIGGGNPRLWPPRPSRATTLKFGFGQVSNFFPGTKALAADLIERIAAETFGTIEPGQALLFDDQYISTGGQMVELIAGHDRFCCDLRPLFYRILEQRSSGHSVVRGLECHPYDVAGALVATQAGVVVTDGFGKPLQHPYDVHTGVHWCGFANETLAKLIQPIITKWLDEHGVTPE
jgi:fructose-1,6-bisphosphatase/inositol monophosphatase family enzyme